MQQEYPRKNRSVKAHAEHLVAVVPLDLAGLRVDQALASLFPDYSRARIQGWIRDGLATVDKQHPRVRDRVAGGERVELIARPTPIEDWRAEPGNLDIVYQDAALIVVDKPAGLVVHPGAGNREGTLVNALLHHAPELRSVPRAGIVHRLDKDTSGLLVVARHLQAHKHLVDALKQRTVKREYNAVVTGLVMVHGKVDAPVGRHRTQRTRMAVTTAGKPALTHYRVARRFRRHTLLNLELQTGRTHQIRVHMAHIGYPLVGDQSYARHITVPEVTPPALRETLRRFARQALHAVRLTLAHPETGCVMHWDSTLPADMTELLASLESHCAR